MGGSGRVKWSPENTLSVMGGEHPPRADRICTGFNAARPPTNDPLCFDAHGLRVSLWGASARDIHGACSTSTFESGQSGVSPVALTPVRDVGFSSLASFASTWAQPREDDGPSRPLKYRRPRSTTRFGRSCVASRPQIARGYEELTAPCCDEIVQYCANAYISTAC